MGESIGIVNNVGLGVKIFEIKSDENTQFFHSRLNNFKIEESQETSDEKELNLSTEIIELKENEGVLRGIFIKDFLVKDRYKRKMVELPIIEEVPFSITSYNDKKYLFVFGPSSSGGQKKLLTNYIANTMSEIIFNTIGSIVEVRIPSETLRELHESNPQATKLIWFDDYDIPGVNKLCLAGSGLADTQLYKEDFDYPLFSVSSLNFSLSII